MKCRGLLSYAAPKADNLYSAIFATKNPMEHVKGLFACLLRNEIANFNDIEPQNGSIIHNAQQRDLNVGSYATLRTQRKKLNSRLNDFCRAQIGDKYGMRFDGVDLTDILPPDELAEALNSVINARSEADRLYAHSESECEQRILSAEKGLTIAKARAKAVEAEITVMGEQLEEIQLNANLHDYLVRRRTEVYSDARASYIRRKS